MSEIIQFPKHARIPQNEAVFDDRSLAEEQEIAPVKRSYFWAPLVLWLTGCVIFLPLMALSEYLGFGVFLYLMGCAGYGVIWGIPLTDPKSRA